MITVLFFASVREQLACEQLELDRQPQWQTLADLRDSLADRGDRWRQVLQQDNLICALNQAVVAPDTPLGDGDEVAFYPPVTGG